MAKSKQSPVPGPAEQVIEVLSTVATRLTPDGYDEFLDYLADHIKTLQECRDDERKG